MSDFIQGLDGDLFIQTSRSQNFSWLSCVSLADIPLPLGDLTTIYCPDPRRKGQVVAAGQIRGEAGAGTTTITRPLSSTTNFLLENSCGFDALIAYGCQGTRAVPENYEFGVVLFDVQPTNSSIIAAIARDRGEDTRIDTNAEVSYTGRYMIYRLQVNTLTMTNTAAANGIAFLPEACETKCAPARDGCSEGYMALDGTLYDSEVKYSDDGSDWNQTSADPFEEGGNAGEWIIFELWDGHRAITNRISPSVWRPAEVSYTEDEGATWTNVDVGSVGAQILTAMDRMSGWIYACATGGDVYRSTDMADSWTRLATGVTTEDLRDITMYTTSTGYAVGDNNAFIYTTNGEDWYARTGPAVGVNLLSVAVNDQGHVFVGANDGNLYRSEDGGLNWLDPDGNAGAWRSFGTGTVDYVEFDEDTGYFGLLIFNNPTPLGSIYTSINGGATWRQPSGQTGTWNSGLNSGTICDQNNYFVVGEVHNGTTFAAKIEPIG